MVRSCSQRRAVAAVESCAAARSLFEEYAYRLGLLSLTFLGKVARSRRVTL